MLVLSSSTNRSSRAMMAAIGRLSGRAGCALSGSLVGSRPVGEVVAMGFAAPS